MMEAGPIPTTFDLLDRHVGLRMGLDLAAVRPGRTTVAATPRRLRREASYGYVRALWWAWLADGRSAISCPPGTAAAVAAVAAGASRAQELADPALAETLRRCVDPALLTAGLPPTDRAIRSLWFACNADLLRRHHDGDCRRLTDHSIPPAEGISLPAHCFPDGVAYGVIADAVVACAAFAHRHGVMEDRVVHVGIDTAGGYRRRGYARTAVSALVAHFTAGGGQGLYSCRPDNTASIATARTVGFVPYGAALVLSAPAPDLAEAK